GMPSPSRSGLAGTVPPGWHGIPGGQSASAVQTPCSFLQASTSQNAPAPQSALLVHAVPRTSMQRPDASYTVPPPAPPSTSPLWSGSPASDPGVPTGVTVSVATS